MSTTETPDCFYCHGNGVQPNGEACPMGCSAPHQDFCSVCDHIRELHELPFVECSHPFTPKRRSYQLSERQP